MQLHGQAAGWGLSLPSPSPHHLLPFHSMLGASHPLTLSVTQLCSHASFLTSHPSYTSPHQSNPGSTPLSAPNARAFHPPCPPSKPSPRASLASRADTPWASECLKAFSSLPPSSQFEVNKNYLRKFCWESFAETKKPFVMQMITPNFPLFWKFGLKNQLSLELKHTSFLPLPCPNTHFHVPTPPHAHWHRRIHVPTSTLTCRPTHRTFMFTGMHALTHAHIPTPESWDSGCWGPASWRAPGSPAQLLLHVLSSTFQPSSQSQALFLS